jgi:hypothetical protein
MKTLAYFPEQVARNGQPVLRAFLDSMRALGFKLEENSMDSDVVVIWSVLWQGRMAKNEAVYRHYCKQHKPVVVLEVGALNRDATWKVMVNHTTADGMHGGMHKELDYDRPGKLGIELKTPSKPRDHIVIAMQHTKSLQTQGVDLTHWANNQIAQLKQYTDRPIHIRPHPRCSINTAQFRDVKIELPQRVANTYDGFDFDLDAHAVVNYNSGPGIQGAINGTRVVVDETSLAYPVSIDVSEIENAYIKDRTQWLVEMCHTEFTLDEIKQGVPYMYLAEYIND